MATTTESPETPAEPGSLSLKNPKYEEYAQRLSWGVPQKEAYVLAGYEDTGSASTNASRIAKKPEIAERVAWLKARIAEHHIYDAARIKERLSAMADALTEIRIDPKSGDRKPGPMFNPTAGARVLELLGKEAGIFKDKIELGGQVQVANRELFERMSPAERAAMKASLLAAAARTPSPANDDEPAAEPDASEVPAAK